LCSTPPPPAQGRAPGRRRKVRIRSSAEDSTILGPRKHTCKRCGELGHIARGYKNAVDPAFGEDEHWGAENAQETLVESSTLDVVPLDEPSNAAIVTLPEPSRYCLFAHFVIFNYPESIIHLVCWAGKRIRLSGEKRMKAKTLLL
jgi:hypothetical protein